MFVIAMVIVTKSYCCAVVAGVNVLVADGAWKLTILMGALGLTPLAALVLVTGNEGLVQSPTRVVPMAPLTPIS